MIDLGLAPATLHAAWDLAIDLAELQPTGWILIGAQMVALQAPKLTSLDLMAQAKAVDS